MRKMDGYSKWLAHTHTLCTHRYCYPVAMGGRGSSKLWDSMQVVQAPHNCDPLAGRPGTSLLHSAGAKMAMFFPAHNWIVFIRRPLPAAGGARQRSKYTQQVVHAANVQVRRKSKNV